MEAHVCLQSSVAPMSSGLARLTSPYDQLKAAIARAHRPTAEHSIRVRICATSLGFACRLMGRELTTLSIAAEVHDIGKLYVPASVLNKTEPLTQADWAIIREHPVSGARMAAGAFPGISDVARCVLYHHERLDGSGYPDGLRAGQIPALARLVAVADAFVALTEDRPFRAAYSDQQAFQVLTSDDAGKSDPEILRVLEHVVMG